jgi:N6-L-threonylcarbamoyladenine synthase
MLILGIESSCDETGVALYEAGKGLIAHRLHSQTEIHREYGGVVPELASRDHIRHLIPLLDNLFFESSRSQDEVDAVAVTVGPGLGGALLAGASVAAGLCLVLDKPLIPVHHMEAHLMSPLMGENAPTMPFVALLVSGGHTQLMAVRSIGDYELLGETIDDAVGEAFDKSASLLGLDYPGGAALSGLAQRGDATRFTFPRPMLKSGNLDFSFSGLKTAVLHEVMALRNANTFGPAARNDVAAGFEAAAVDVLVGKSMLALRQSNSRTLVVAGGVSANRRLRAQLAAELSAIGARAYFPPIEFCGDNGAMVAHAAALRISAGLVPTTLPVTLFSVSPRMPMATRASN